MSVKGFERTDGLFSLCGLNCGLCGFRLQGGCNGCFKDSFCAAQCPMAPCSVKHGNLQYDRLMAFCLKHMDNRFALKDDVSVDAREIISREIISNILIHRDYTSAFPANLFYI